MITIHLIHLASGSYTVDDDGGLCGLPETVPTYSQAQAAAEQRMRVYAMRGIPVLPWEQL